MNTLGHVNDLQPDGHESWWTCKRCSRHRLYRRYAQLIETLEELETQGIGFLSLTEAIDTTSSGGRLVFHIFGALAEFERSIIRERTPGWFRRDQEDG